MRRKALQSYLSIQIQGVEDLFNYKMEAVIKLGIEGNLNRSSDFEFEDRKSVV